MITDYEGRAGKQLLKIDFLAEHFTQKTSKMTKFRSRTKIFERTLPDNLDFCSPNPCKNSGSCSLPSSSTSCKAFNCACTGGWSGNTCEEIDDYCVLPSPPCKHGAGCSWKFASPFYTCSCATGFKGRTCEESLSKCIPNPCRNGGKCNEANSASGYECECFTSYTG